MIKAYRIVEETYICGDLEKTWKCNKVLYTEEEAEEYNKNHTYIYDTIEDIKKWHKKEFFQELEYYILFSALNFLAFILLKLISIIN